MFKAISEQRKACSSHVNKTRLWEQYMDCTPCIGKSVMIVNLSKANIQHIGKLIFCKFLTDIRSKPTDLTIMINERPLLQFKEECSTRACSKLNSIQNYSNRNKWKET